MPAASIHGRNREGAAMAESMQSLAKRGLISAGAMNATLAKTKVQKSKMASFTQDTRDEGGTKYNTPPIGRTDHINNARTQKDRVPGGSMPSRNTGGKATGIIGANNRSQSKQGGAVGASTQPHRGQIDGFPGKQAKTFPAGTGVKASKGFTGNSRMKGGPKPKSGGPYGGPSSRAAG